MSQSNSSSVMPRKFLRSGRTLQQQQQKRRQHYTKNSSHDRHHQCISSNNGNDNVIAVAHSCLLVPAVLIVWYYWFRKSARQVISRVVDADSVNCAAAPSYDPDHKNTTNLYDEEAIGKGSSEDEYSTWEEVIENHDTSDSCGFVRWIDNDTAVTRVESDGSSFDEESLAPADTTISASLRSQILLKLPASFARRKRKSSMRHPRQVTFTGGGEESAIHGIRWEVLPNRGVELDLVQQNSTTTKIKEDHPPTISNNSADVATMLLGLKVQEGVCA